jgi:hypothetical protein
MLMPRPLQQKQNLAEPATNRNVEWDCSDIAQQVHSWAHFCNLASSESGGAGYLEFLTTSRNLVVAAMSGMSCKIKSGKLSTLNYNNFPSQASAIVLEPLKNVQQDHS